MRVCVRERVKERREKVEREEREKFILNIKSMVTERELG